MLASLPFNFVLLVLAHVGGRNGLDTQNAVTSPAWGIDFARGGRGGGGVEEVNGNRSLLTLP